MKNPKKGRFLIVIVVALAILGWQLLTTFGGTGGVSDKEKNNLLHSASHPKRESDSATQL